MENMQTKVLSLFSKLDIEVNAFDTNVNQFIIEVAQAVLQMSTLENDPKIHHNAVVDTYLLLTRYDNLLKIRNPSKQSLDAWSTKDPYNFIDEMKSNFAIINP